MTTETRDTVKETKENIYDFICSFCDYGPYGENKCPEASIQRDLIKNGFCGFADIDGCQAQITKDYIVVHNVYNPNTQKTNSLEDVKVSRSDLLKLKDTLNKVPGEHRKKDSPTTSIISKLFENDEANV